MQTVLSMTAVNTKTCNHMTLLTHNQQGHMTTCHKHINRDDYNQLPSVLTPLAIMKSLPHSLQKTIISMLNSHHSYTKIQAATGVARGSISKLASKHCSSLTKSLGGHPSKLSTTNIRHAIHLISSRKAETAVAIARSLAPIIGSSVSSQTVSYHLKKAALKAAVKQKKPLLTNKHTRARMDFALKHKYWTLEDWKKVVWSDETKINRSDGRKWVWKKQGEGLSDRLVKGTLKYGGGSVMVLGCIL